MQRQVLAIAAVLALGACSSSNTPSGTGTTGGTTGGDAGSITITYTTVDVHPAARAWATAAQWPVPNLNSGGYQLILNGVGIDLTKNPPSVLTPLGQATITSVNGPYVFTVSTTVLNENAPLGALAGISPPTSDAGTSDAGLPQPTCAQFAQLQALVSDVAADGGNSTAIAAALAAASPPFVDYFVPTGSIVGPGVAAAPTADVPSAVAYAVPISFAVALNCGGSTTKATRDTDLGVALVFDTAGTTQGGGTPVQGATFNVMGSPSNPMPVYYSGNFSATSGTSTDASGIATFTNVLPGAAGFGYLTVGGTTSPRYNLATNPNSFFNVLVYHQ